MLPSPPLTADSCCPSPRSLKRTLSDAADDAYTPPATPPLKRRRCPASFASPSAPQDVWATVGSSSFDPDKLVTPPEYTHVPYDPEFGRKVCRQYKKSLIVQRACDAVTTAARKQKYGEAAALAHSPGSTPDHIRRSYEDEQRRLDEAFAEIIANSESESEPVHEHPACMRSNRDLGSKPLQGRRTEFDTSMGNISSPYLAQHAAISRDIIRPQLKHIGSCDQHQSHKPPALLRSDDYSSFSSHTRLQSSNGVASFTARAQSASRISQLRKRYRMREQHRSSLMVGS